MGQSVEFGQRRKVEGRIALPLLDEFHQFAEDAALQLQFGQRLAFADLQRSERAQPLPVVNVPSIQRRSSDGKKKKKKKTNTETDGPVQQPDPGLGYTHTHTHTYDSIHHNDNDKPFLFRSMSMVE